MQHCEECSHIHDPSLARFPGSGLDGLKSFTKCLLLILRLFLGAYFSALLYTPFKKSCWQLFRKHVVYAILSFCLSFFVIREDEHFNMLIGC